jgi:hypothetical protein
MSKTKELKKTIEAEAKEDFDFEQHLFKKYPSLFPTDKDGELLPQMQRCWNDCPKGWEQLVDDLFFAINNYVVNTKQYVKDPSKKHIYAVLDVLRSRRFAEKGFGDLLAETLLDDRFRGFSGYINQHPPAVKIAQYKEKFGTLRIYIDGGDDTVEGMILFAEHLSSVTCQATGKRGQICQRGGWYSTLCEEEGEAHGYAPTPDFPV